jgi:hypothetical protein
MGDRSLRIGDWRRHGRGVSVPHPILRIGWGTGAILRFEWDIRRLFPVGCSTLCGARCLSGVGSRLFPIPYSRIRVLRAPRCMPWVRRGVRCE